MGGGVMGILIPILSGRSVAVPWVPSGTTAWYKADALALTDGAAVTSWTDSSGNSHPATQAVALQQPVYKTNILNSLPVVRFNAANLTTLATALFTLDQPVSVFMVVMVKDNTADQYPTDALTLNQRAFILDISNPGDVSLYGGGTLFNVNAGLASNSYNVLGAIFNGASSLISINGTATTGVTSGASASGITIGSGGAGNQPLGGDIGEILFYASSISADLEACTEGYLAWKWGLQGSLPGGHPYKSAAPLVGGACP